MKVGVICSDDRMMQTADNLSEDHEVIRIQADTDLLSLPLLDALILPVKGLDENHNIQMWNSYLHVPSSFWQIQGKELRFFQGLESSTANALPVKKYYYMQAEEVLDQNAILTAEGVLNEIISHTCKSIYAIQVDIVGFGHCGKAIYQMLKNLHVKVRVIRRECCLCEEFCPLGEWKECGDVIVYTAPVNVLTSQMEHWTKKPLFLDISTPKLFQEEELHRYGWEYEKINNLPGRFACISAGNIIASYVRGNLHEE